MVEVAVIGAGAAGLVAARHLLQCGLRACIFESRRFVGGAWGATAAHHHHHHHQATARRGDERCFDNNDNGPNNRVRMWDTLTPNLSKYTSCFSDSAWPDETPTFPTLDDMNQYLKDYAEKYVRHHNNDDNCLLNFGCTVTNVCSYNNNDPHVHQYTVEWTTHDGDGTSLHSKAFDGVVVATGFFATPAWPEGLQDLVEKQQQRQQDATVLHSSEYTSSPEGFANQTVAVIGGSFSAHEIASDVRRHAKRVVNVMGNHVPYILRRYVPSNDNDDDNHVGGSDHGGFLPLDYVLYRRKENAPTTPELTTMDPDAIRKRHDYLGHLLGSRKQAQLRAKGIPIGEASSLALPAMVSISDDYLNLVIDDKIEVVRGRLARAVLADSSNDGEDSPKTVNIELEDGATIAGVDRIISCTGYRSRLNFLAPDILNTLEYDESDHFAPLTLCYDAFHPKLPGLGFVGMYKGAYFGVMELQARLVAGLISGQVGPLSEADVSQALQSSRNIRKQTPRAQFPHFDYVGMMDTLAQKLDLVPDPSTFGRKGMMVTPAFYQPDDEIARKCKEQLDDEVRNQNNNIPKAAFSALVGKWTFERTIHDNLTCSTQRVHGEIAYSLQRPHFETLRYREDGFLDLPTGNKLEVFREYDYLKKDGVLEIYFVEDGERAHMFLSLKFKKQEDGYWVATSDHLCIKDLYKGTFKIAFDGIGASEVSMTYRVKGPHKDYESVTHLRPLPS